jgi:hypothetical protein
LAIPFRLALIFFGAGRSRDLLGRASWGSVQHGSEWLIGVIPPDNGASGNLYETGSSPKK